MRKGKMTSRHHTHAQCSCLVREVTRDYQVGHDSRLHRIPRESLFHLWVCLELLVVSLMIVPQRVFFVVPLR